MLKRIVDSVFLAWLFLVSFLFKIIAVMLAYEQVSNWLQQEHLAKLDGLMTASREAHLVQAV
jgi:hypothetical protein